MSLWNDDLIQFARLLSEIAATQDNLDVQALMDEMGLEREDIEELFQRAEDVWQDTKDRLADNQQRASTRPRSVVSGLARRRRRR